MSAGIGESPAAHTSEKTRSRLQVVRWVALTDMLLLIALLVASRTGNRDLVRLLGPVHGINYLALVALVGTAAIDRIWGWWFPLAVLLTGGPPGALVGEWLVGRRVRAERHMEDGEGGR